MKLRMFRRASARKTNAILDGAVPEPANLGRRALLTGGAVMAGVAGAGVVAAATSGPASAATGDPVLQGSVNTVGTNAATEIDAANANGAPTMILGNTGSPGANQASPQLRLTPPSDTTLVQPPTTTAGGDIVASGDGFLYFTHAFTGGAVWAGVHTDATANSFVPLSAPQRILDTRSASGRTHVRNPSGAFDSTGRLLAGHTIYVDLTSMVAFGDAVTSNLTVISPAGNGWVLVWPGAGSRPNSASISFSKGQAISNLTVSGIAQYTSSTSPEDTVAITTSVTTHVIFDVSGFHVGSLGQVNPSVSAFGSTNAASPAGRSVGAKAASIRAASIRG